MGTRVNASRTCCISHTTLRLCAQVQVVRGGSDEAHIFLQHLLDDPTTSSASEAAPGGAGVPLNLGLQAFMEHIRLEVIRMLKA